MQPFPPFPSRILKVRTPSLRGKNRKKGTLVQNPLIHPSHLILPCKQCKGDDGSGVNDDDDRDHGHGVHDDRDERKNVPSFRFRCFLPPGFGFDPELLLLLFCQLLLIH